MEVPKFPNDLEELKHIEKLLNKVDEFKLKLAELDEQIKKVSQSSQEASTFIKKYEVEALLYKSFFSDLENRPFNSEEDNSIARLKAEIVWEGVIFKRNISCEVCGENRSIDKCHIIPNRTGGLKEDDNLLYLCPTHHRMFDRFMLSKKEWCAIDWEKKSRPSQVYAETITLDAHKKFWQRVESKDYSKLPMYETKDVLFIEFVVKELFDLFIERKPMKRTNIMKLLDDNIKDVASKVLTCLIKEGVIHKICEGSKEMLFLPDTKIDQDVVKRIWQKIA